MIRQLLLLLFIAGLLSCNKKDVNDDPASFMKVTLVKDSIAADSRVFGELIIEVPAEIVAEKNNISLSISPIGKFSDDKTSTAVKADGLGTAHVFFRSETSGKAVITVTIGSYSRSVPVTFIGTVNPVDILEVSLTRDNVSANNISFAEITAITKDNAAILAKKKIIFKTDKGSFSTGSTAGTVEVNVDGTGKAKAYLKSDQAGLARVLINVEGGYTQEIYVTFVNGLPAKDILDLQLVKDTIPADNYSYAELVAVSKDTEVINARKDITFVTDKGLFANGEKTFVTKTDLTGKARAFLKHNQAGLVRVNATISNAYTQEQYIRFVPSLPDALFVHLSTGVVTNSLTATFPVTAELRKTVGEVTPGLPVLFRAFRDNGSSIGSFINVVPTGADNKTTANFYIQDTAYSGHIMLHSYFVKSIGDTVKGNSQVLIIK